MTNPLENINEKLTHMHKMVITWWCWHICKGQFVSVETDQIGEEKEKKRTSYGCPGVRSCNITCSQLAAIVGGGIALFGVHRTGHHHPRAVPRVVPKKLGSLNGPVTMAVWHCHFFRERRKLIGGHRHP